MFNYKNLDLKQKVLLKIAFYINISALFVAAYFALDIENNAILSLFAMFGGFMMYVNLILFFSIKRSNVYIDLNNNATPHYSNMELDVARIRYTIERDSFRRLNEKTISSIHRYDDLHK